ncbi:hypothetical protein DQ04_02311080 [Trypanosoma grayi]|uniref:hypothetical protein n=1 Tax=Trypanosoma grayi TaxID=71804 RepID=UPI0004F46CA7|nr:hypothetical protein DQ04_02311080 [Trypanosoma grayi]KEG11756.1 hypothetical protein DQ04_02311080 [Trypanosoma grayi]
MELLYFQLVHSGALLKVSRIAAEAVYGLLLLYELHLHLRDTTSETFIVITELVHLLLKSLSLLLEDKAAPLAECVMGDSILCFGFEQGDVCLLALS